MTQSLVALLTALAVMGVTAAVSRRVDRVAVVDVAWGSAFVAIALVLAVVCLVAMLWFNPQVALAFVVLMLLGLGVCWLSLRGGGPQPDAAIDRA